MGIVKMTKEYGGSRHIRFHDFLVDVLCKVSVRFRRLATDCSLWKGSVWIHPRGDPGKVEFVVQKCLNSGTREFVLSEDEPSAENAHLDPPCYLCRRHGTRGLENETERFPNMRLVYAARDSGIHTL